MKIRIKPTHLTSHSAGEGLSGLVAGGGVEGEVELQPFGTGDFGEELEAEVAEELAEEEDELW